MTDELRYWIRTKGEAHGPYSLQEAYQYVKPDSLVGSSDQGPWERVELHPEFAAEPQPLGGAYSLTPRQRWKQVLKGENLVHILAA